MSDGASFAALSIDEDEGTGICVVSGISSEGASNGSAGRIDRVGLIALILTMVEVENASLNRWKWAFFINRNHLPGLPTRHTKLNPSLCPSDQPGTLILAHCSQLKKSESAHGWIVRISGEPPSGIYSTL